MDADRWRRRHRRRCLMRCRPPPGRPRRGLRSVQRRVEITAACCNDCRRTCSYTTADESRSATAISFEVDGSDRQAVSEAPFVVHVVDCRTSEMTQQGEKVRMRDLLCPAFSGLAFSEILVLLIPVLLFPVIHFQRPRLAAVTADCHKRKKNFTAVCTTITDSR